MLAHLFCAPLRHLTGKQRGGDYADQTPQRNTEGAAGHEAVRIGLARRPESCGIGRPNCDAQNGAPNPIVERR